MLLVHANVYVGKKIIYLSHQLIGTTTMVQFMKFDRGSYAFVLAVIAAGDFGDAALLAGTKALHLSRPESALAVALAPRLPTAPRTARPRFGCSRRNGGSSRSGGFIFLTKFVIYQLTVAIC